jgi:hypothetical protein
MKNATFNRAKMWGGMASCRRLVTAAVRASGRRDVVCRLHDQLARRPIQVTKTARVAVHHFRPLLSRLKHPCISPGNASIRHTASEFLVSWSQSLHPREIVFEIDRMNLERIARGLDCYQGGPNVSFRNQHPRTVLALVPRPFIRPNDLPSNADEFPVIGKRVGQNIADCQSPREAACVPGPD